MEPPQEPLRFFFGREKQRKKLPPGSVIWKDMRSNASNDAANFGNKHIEQLCRVPTPCIAYHQFEQRGTGNGGRIVKSLLSRRPENAFILARVTRHSMVCELSRFSGHNMDESFCGRRLALSISYIHNTNDYTQCCHVGSTAKQYRLRLFQLEDSVGIRRKLWRIVGGLTFVPIRWTLLNTGIW